MKKKTKKVKIDPAVKREEEILSMKERLTKSGIRENILKFFMKSMLSNFNPENVLPEDIFSGVGISRRLWNRNNQKRKFTTERFSKRKSLDYCLTNHKGEIK